MFRQPSDTLKQKAAHAKRTASILRGIAALPDIPAADQTTLAKAARILDGIAGHKRKESAAAKRVEQAREKALAKAQPEALRLVMLWPAGSFVDQVAIIRLSLDWNYFARRIGDASAPLDARRHLTEYLDDARREIASSLAWKTADGKGDLAALEAQQRDRLEAARGDAQTQIAVLRLQALIEREKVAA
jgi:hypothetical protein